MLHIISRTPLAGSLLDRMAPNDQVLFIENSVYLLLKNSVYEGQLTSLLARTRCYVLDTDLDLRGIDRQSIMPGMETVDYSGFVQLTVDNPIIKTW